MTRLVIYGAAVGLAAAAFGCGGSDEDGSASPTGPVEGACLDAAPGSQRLGLGDAAIVDCHSPEAVGSIASLPGDSGCSDRLDSGSVEGELVCVGRHGPVSVAAAGTTAAPAPEEAGPGGCVDTAVDPPELVSCSDPAADEQIVSQADDPGECGAYGLVTTTSGELYCTLPYDAPAAAAGSPLPADLAGVAYTVEIDVSEAIGDCSKSRREAERVAARASAAGFPAQAFASDLAATRVNGLFCVYSGTYNSDAEALAGAAPIEAAGFTAEPAFIGNQ